MWDIIKEFFNKVKGTFLTVAAVIGTVFTAVFLIRSNSNKSPQLSKEAKEVKKDIKETAKEIASQEGVVTAAREEVDASKGQLEDTVQEVKDSLNTQTKENRDNLSKEFFKEL